MKRGQGFWLVFGNFMVTQRESFGPFVGHLEVSICVYIWYEIGQKTCMRTMKTNHAFAMCGTVQTPKQGSPEPELELRFS